MTRAELLTYCQEQAACFHEASRASACATVRHEQQRVRDAYLDCAARLIAVIGPPNPDRCRLKKTATEDGDAYVCEDCGRVTTVLPEVRDDVCPARALRRDDVLALVNQALTRAGSRHIVGTRNNVIVACTVDELTR